MALLSAMNVKMGFCYINTHALMYALRVHMLLFLAARNVQ